jgi:hypothetical protein
LADDRDILGKADALLRRHVPPRTGSGDSGDVPVLTELITPGAVPAASSAREEPPVATPPSAPGHDVALRRELVAEVVSTVQARLARDLERRIAEHATAEIRASIAAALEGLQDDIAAAARDAVAEALARRPNR